jgi:hypothetical protein
MLHQARVYHPNVANVNQTKRLGGEFVRTYDYFTPYDCCVKLFTNPTIMDRVYFPKASFVLKPGDSRWDILRGITLRDLREGAGRKNRAMDELHRPVSVVEVLSSRKVT